MTESWKSTVSFTTRLSHVVQITAAYKAAHPTEESANASSASRKLETGVFKDSNSLDDYENGIQETISELEALTTTKTETVETNDSIAAQLLSKAIVKAKFGRYRQAVHFKNGLFSEVYVAQAPVEGNPVAFTGAPGTYVALKATSLSSMVPPHNSEREVRILRKTAGSNIIPLLESFHDGAGHLVLVMPFMPVSLDALISSEKAKREGMEHTMSVNMKKCLRDLFSAIEHLHTLKVIHRDIKPSNILLQSPSGPAYLADFGISWLPGDPASEKPDEKITDVGTTCYRAPEVLFGDRAYDTSFDLWAAGCVVAEAAAGTGKSLFEPGDVGTDLTLVMSIFQSLGTPNRETWPELEKIPDWGKIPFKEYPAKPWEKLLPNASGNARNLVSQLVRYSGNQRMSARKALEHPLLGNIE